MARVLSEVEAAEPEEKGEPSMKLGYKIGGGFGAMIAISIALGAWAVRSMGTVGERTETVANSDMPKLSLLVEVERAAQQTAFEMRKFVYTAEEKDFEPVAEHQKETLDLAEQVRRLADSLADGDFRAQAAGLQQVIAQYAEQCSTTHAAVLASKTAYAEALGALNRFAQQTQDLSEDNLKQLQKNIEENGEHAVSSERATKLALLINAGAHVMTALENLRQSRLEQRISPLDDARRLAEEAVAGIGQVKAVSAQSSDFARIEEAARTGGEGAQKLGALKQSMQEVEKISAQRAVTIRKLLETAQERSASEVNQTRRAGTAAFEELRSASRSVLVGLVAATILGALIAYLITSGILKPVKQALGLAQSIERGDLSQRLRLSLQDEIGAMCRALDSMSDGLQQKANLASMIADGDITSDVTLASEKDVLGGALQRMTANLNEILAKVSDAAEMVSSGSSQVSDASQSLSQGATEQAASLEEITSSMTEIGSQTKANAEGAGQAKVLATSARDAAQNGVAQVHSMVQAMEEIRTSSREIVKIIKVIDDIAFQTNLLALNAAVEAARAGRHGKGFAVVAEEVRNLAARSAKAAQQTAEGIEGSMNRVEHGVEIAQLTAKALGEISEGITKVNDLVGDIAAASSEQAQGISQVSIGMTQIDSVTQQSTANAEETASAAEELSTQAKEMRSLLAHFRLKNQDHRREIDARPSERVISPGKASKPVERTASKVAVAAKRGEFQETIALDSSEFGRF